MNYNLIVCLLFLVSLANCDQKGGWTIANVNNSSWRPDSREGGAFFEKKNDHLIIFGEHQESIIVIMPNIFFNYMFELNLTTDVCSHIDNGTGPNPRTLFCYEYDSNRETLFVWEGVRYTSDFFSFTFFNDTWTQLFSFQSPSEREDPLVMLSINRFIYSVDR